MPSTDLSFGIPSLELCCSSGEMINPASFAGHQLVVLFCPLDPQMASNEIAAYLAHAIDFVDNDAWLLTFVEQGSGPALAGRGRVLTIGDPEREGWEAFRKLAKDPAMDRRAGATFLFTRGGNLHRYWNGFGHVDGVVAELRTPSSEHLQQSVG